MLRNDTICALSTAPGMGALALIRLSGSQSIELVARLFTGFPADLQEIQSHKSYFGKLMDDDSILDEALVSVFRNPRSFTGEDSVEISCHGSVYIQQRILELLLENGARMADPGEFSMRAFMNGKMDLSQAEAVADLIESEGASDHRLAMQQLRGGFSKEIDALREELIHFASLVELELDFSEEEVEFADRTQLKELLSRIESKVTSLLSSFRLGNAIKNGIPIAIVGSPNAGKSTLLNALLQEERALVSDIPGTTRDTVEEVLILGGIKFRFIDTAGLRDTKDIVESMGIERTWSKIEDAQIVLYLFDASVDHKVSHIEIGEISGHIDSDKLIIVANKIDAADAVELENEFTFFPDLLKISALSHKGLDALKDQLLSRVNLGEVKQRNVTVTNARHAEALRKAKESIDRVDQGLDDGISGDLVAMDIRQVLQDLGEITGEVSTDDLLGNIFGKFCIGK